jgi:peptide/nickel transport system permease protein
VNDNIDNKFLKIFINSKLSKFILILIKNKPLGALGFIITILLLFAGLFADYLAPYGINEIHLSDRLLAPSARFWLGTDNLGRDILSRVIYGARVSLIVGFSVSIIATFISISLGMLSAYIGGKFDLIIQRFVDGFMCIPILIIIMVVISMLGQGLIQLIVIMGISFGISGSRNSRGFALTILQNTYIEAAKAIGCSTSRILILHVLLNILPLIIVGFTILLPGVILMEAGLSFLGYGIPPPAPSWGGMLSGTNRSYMYLAPWMVIWPGFALSLVVFGTHMFGDAMRDLLDPRLKNSKNNNN